MSEVKEPFQFSKSPKEAPLLVFISKTLTRTRFLYHDSCSYSWMRLKNSSNFEEKLHFIILNYVLEYILHLKLFDCTLYILNYHIYHTLHSDIIFIVIFNKILQHVTSTYFLLRWNKVRKLKHPSSKSIKTKPILFPKFSFKIFKFTSLIP